MPKETNQGERVEMKEEAREHFEDFLSSFDGLEKSVREQVVEMQKVGELLSEDLIPAIDELKEEIKVLRMATVESLGRKPKTLLGHATQEIFGVGE